MSTSPTPLDQAREIALADLLALRLTWLSYHPFALSVIRVLERSGFDNLCLSSRRSLKGRTHNAGFDAHGNFCAAGGDLAVLIQLKRYRAPVPRQFVDVLHSAMERHSVPQGLIVSTSSFAPAAREAVCDYRENPIRLIEGRELGFLMMRSGIGVRVQVELLTGRSHLVIDEEAFERLEQETERLDSRVQKGAFR